MSHGYANEDSYQWDVIWANDQTLYEAIKTHTKSMRPHYEVMTDQTLGRNVRDAIQAAMCDGGWGWRSCPDAFTHIPRETWDIVSGTVTMGNVNEEEFGANVRTALEAD